MYVRTYIHGNHTYSILNTCILVTQSHKSAEERNVRLESCSVASPISTVCGCNVVVYTHLYLSHFVREVLLIIRVQLYIVVASLSFVFSNIRWV